MIRKIALALFILVLGGNTLHAQWSIETSYFFKDYTLKDEVLSPYVFDGTDSGWLNFALEYRKGKNVFKAGYTQSGVRAETTEDFDAYYTFNELSSFYYSIELEYLRELIEWQGNWKLFGGVSNSARFSYNELLYSNQFITGFNRTHELAAVNIRPNVVIQKEWKNLTLESKIGLSFFSYGSRPDGVETKVEIGSGLNQSFEWNNEFSGEYSFSPLFSITASYILNYYTYPEPDRLRYLTQTYSMGLKLKL